MGMHAISQPVAHPRRESSVFPVCVTAVALAALSPTLSILTGAAVERRSVSTIRAVAEPAPRHYTVDQIPPDDAKE
jgi:hypothetical protein